MSHAVRFKQLRISALALGASVLASGLAFSPASAQQTQPRSSAPAGATQATTQVTTKDFVTKAAIGSMYEVEAGKLASERAQSNEVKQIAQRIVKDHSAAQKDLKEALSKSKAGVQPPAELDSEHQQKLQKLKAAQGAGFDSLYVSMMRDDHENDHELFQAYARNGEDPALKAFAEKTLKVIDAHNDAIAKIEKK